MVKNQYKVHEISHHYTKEWIYKKHYAKRRCPVSYSFGLFDNKNILVGVCTFGSSPNRQFNDGKCVFDNYSVKTLELNRLVTNDNLDKNALSYFVSQCLNQLPKPTCIVSYADPNEGHYGYIYQATNWIYTGESSAKYRYYYDDGSCFDLRRGADKKVEKHGAIIKKQRLIPTQRYIYFNGNKRDKKAMHKHFKMKKLKYPKGQNKNYNTNYECKQITWKEIKLQNMIKTNGEDKMEGVIGTLVSNGKVYDLQVLSQKLEEYTNKGYNYVMFKHNGEVFPLADEDLKSIQ